MHIAPSEARPGTSRQALATFLVGALYVLGQLVDACLRFLSIRTGAHRRIAGEHMPVRLPDANSITAWAVGPLDARMGHHERERDKS